MKEKKLFEKPMVVITPFEDQDVISTSSEDDGILGLNYFDI